MPKVAQPESGFKPTSCLKQFLVTLNSQKGWVVILRLGKPLPGCSCAGTRHLFFIIWFCVRGAGEGEEGGRGHTEGPVGSTLWITCCGFVRVPWTPGFAAALGWTWLADGFSPFLCQTCRGVSPHVRPERGAVPFRDPSAPRLTTGGGWTFWFRPLRGHLWSYWGPWRKQKWEKLLEEAFNSWAGAKQENTSEGMSHCQETSRNNRERL